MKVVEDNYVSRVEAAKYFLDRIERPYYRKCSTCQSIIEFNPNEFTITDSMEMITQRVGMLNTRNRPADAVYLEVNQHRPNYLISKAGDDIMRYEFYLDFLCLKCKHTNHD